MLATRGARPPLAPSPPASGASRLRQSRVSLSRRSSIGVAASVECYWERPRERTACRRWHSSLLDVIPLPDLMTASLPGCVNSQVPGGAGLGRKAVVARPPLRWASAAPYRCTVAPRAPSPYRQTAVRRRQRAAGRIACRRTTESNRCRRTMGTLASRQGTQPARSAEPTNVMT
jgi:hypothetical protein